MDRKLVKPAHEAGRIYNPEHRNFLPKEGTELEMTPFWIGLQQRGDIIVSDLPAPSEIAPVAAPPA